MIMVWRCASLCVSSVCISFSQLLQKQLLRKNVHRHRASFFDERIPITWKTRAAINKKKGIVSMPFFSTTAETEKMDILLKGVFSCLLHDPSDSCIPFYNSMSCMTKMHFSAREAQGNKTGLYGVLFSCIFFKHLILSSHPFVEKRSHAWLMFPQKLFSSSLGLHSSSSLWRRCWWSCLWISSFRSSKLLFPSSSWHHIWLSFKYHCQYNIDMKGRGGL